VGVVLDADVGEVVDRRVGGLDQFLGRQCEVQGVHAQAAGELPRLEAGVGG
jgi:hypothetical protein